MSSQKRVALFVENILNDPDMEHLKLKDLRNFVLHMQGLEDYAFEEEEDESDEELRQYVL